MNERCHDRFPREGITNERVKEIEKTGECNIKPPQPNETLGGGLENTMLRIAKPHEVLGLSGTAKWIWLRNVWKNIRTQRPSVNEEIATNHSHGNPTQSSALLATFRPY